MKIEPNTEKSEPESLRKLFIGGLDRQTTDEDLASFYKQWGELTDCVVMKDPKTGMSRGFGFVTYARLAMVDEAMANRPHKVGNRQVEPKRAIPREICDKSTAKVKKLFIGGLSKLADDKDLEEYFSQFGKLTDCAVVTAKDTGERRGFGFVEYDDVDVADKVVLLQDHIIKGRAVEVKKAIPRDGPSERGVGRRDTGGDRSSRGGPAGVGGPPQGDGGWGGNQWGYNGYNDSSGGTGGGGGYNQNWGNQQPNNWGGSSGSSNAGWGNDNWSQGGAGGGSGYQQQNYDHQQGYGGGGGYGGNQGGWPSGGGGANGPPSGSFNNRGSGNRFSGNSGGSGGGGGGGGGSGGNGGPMRAGNYGNRSAPYPNQSGGGGSGSYGGGNYGSRGKN